MVGENMFKHHDECKDCQIKKLERQLLTAIHELVELGVCPKGGSTDCAIDEDPWECIDASITCTRCWLKELE